METIERKFKYTSVLTALFVFALGISAFFFINGQVNKKNEKAKEIILQAETESMNKKKIRSLESFLENSKTEIAELEKHFVYRSDIVPFLQFVENLGEQVSLTAKVSSVDESVEGKDLFVTTDTIGSYESTYKFLKLLENAPYKIEITSLDLRDESLEEGSAWRGSIKMRVISFIP